MIHIACKITNFSLHLFVYFFENIIMIGLWLLSCMMLQNKECRAHTLMVDYWKAHKPVHFVQIYVLSVIQQYKHRTTWKALLQSIQKIQKIPSWSMSPICRCVKAIMPQFQQYQAHFITLLLWEVPLCLTLKPLHDNYKSSPYTVVKKE